MAIQEQYPKIYKQIKLKGQDKENMTTNQFNKFMRIARDFSKRYVHDIHYVSDALRKMYFSLEGKQDPHFYRQKLINLMDNPHRYRHTNCLASATYMSYELQKLGIPHNIIIYFEEKDENGFQDYQGVVLYKYKDQLLVCDLFLGNQYPEFAELFLQCPYKQYAELYELATDAHLNFERGFIFGTKIYPHNSENSWSILSQWDCESFGLYSVEKYELIKEQLRTIYYGEKYRKKV